MAFVGPVMAENHLNMVCRNTPHLYGKCDGENGNVDRIRAGLNGRPEPQFTAGRAAKGGHRARTELRGTLKDWLKFADHLEDHGLDLIDRTDSTVLPLNSYIRGYVSCHVHLRFGYLGWEFGPHDFCVDFRSARFVRSDSEHLLNHAHTEDRNCAGRQPGDAVGGNQKINWQPVFIDVNKLA